MLEAGSVRAKNNTNILIKNLLDGAIGGIVYWAVGYGLAFGDDVSPGGSGGNPVIGTQNFFLTGDPDYTRFFFQVPSPCVPWDCCLIC